MPNQPRLADVGASVASMLRRYEDAQALTSAVTAALEGTPPEFLHFGTEGSLVIDGGEKKTHRAEQVEQLGHVFARIDHALIMAYGTADGCRVALPVVPTMHTRQAAATLRSMARDTPRTAATFRRKIDAACDEALAILRPTMPAPPASRPPVRPHDQVGVSGTHQRHHLDHDPKTVTQLHHNGSGAKPAELLSAVNATAQQAREAHHDSAHAPHSHGTHHNDEGVASGSFSSLSFASSSETSYSARFAARDGLLRLTSDVYDDAGGDDDDLADAVDVSAMLDPPRPSDLLASKEFERSSTWEMSRDLFGSSGSAVSSGHRLLEAPTSAASGQKHHDRTKLQSQAQSSANEFQSQTRIQSQQSMSDPWAEALTARLRRISEAVRAAEQHAVALRSQCEAVVAQLEEARAARRAAAKKDAAPNASATTDKKV